VKRQVACKTEKIKTGPSVPEKERAVFYCTAAKNWHQSIWLLAANLRRGHKKYRLSVCQDKQHLCRNLEKCLFQGVFTHERTLRKIYKFFLKNPG